MIEEGNEGLIKKQELLKQQNELLKKEFEAIKETTETIKILKQLAGNKPFITTAKNYGKALAESILAKSQATPAVRINFDDELKKTIQFNSGSYALIYKSNSPTRIAPFIWQLDQQTRGLWGVFTFNNFYGHRNSKKPWKRISTPIVVTPFENSTEMVDSFAKGYLAKYDEKTQFQMPLTLKDSAALEALRNKARQFISAALMLWMDLQTYTKPKLNIKMIVIIILIAAAIALIYFYYPTITKALTGALPH